MGRVLLGLSSAICRDKINKNLFHSSRTEKHFHLHLKRHNTLTRLEFHIISKMGFALNFPETRDVKEKKLFAIGYNSVLLPSPPICYLTAVREEEEEVKKNT